MGYQQIKRLAKRSGLNIPELLTLHRKNDPFFVGSPAQVAQAEWFAELWERFDYRTGVHLRRVHYRLASQESATKHDGEPYEWNERLMPVVGQVLRKEHEVQQEATDVDELLNRASRACRN